MSVIQLAGLCILALVLGGVIAGLGTWDAAVGGATLIGPN